MPLSQEYYPVRRIDALSSYIVGGIVMASPLVGAWELVSDTRQGIHIYTETHYSVVMMSKDRQRIAEPTTDDILESYQDVAALAGTYTVSGSKITLHRIANTRAEAIGVDIEGEFTIEGDKLTLRTISGTSRRGAGEQVLRKVG